MEYSYDDGYNCRPEDHRWCLQREYFQWDCASQKLHYSAQCGTMTQIPIYPDAPATAPTPSVKPNINIELL